MQMSKGPSVKDPQIPSRDFGVPCILVCTDVQMMARTPRPCDAQSFSPAWFVPPPAANFLTAPTRPPQRCDETGAIDTAGSKRLTGRTIC